MCTIGTMCHRSPHTTLGCVRIKFGTYACVQLVSNIKKFLRFVTINNYSVAANQTDDHSISITAFKHVDLVGINNMQRNVL